MTPLNININVGTPAADLAKGAEKDSRLHITGTKGERVVLAKGIDMINSGKKATLYNAVGHVWTKIKNTFSSSSEQVMARRKYVPLTVTDSKGKEKVVFVNVNSVMKHLLGATGKDRERKLNELTGMAQYADFAGALKGNSTSTKAEQGEFIRAAINEMAEGLVGCNERRDKVAVLVERPISKEVLDSCELSPMRSDYSHTQFRGVTEEDPKTKVYEDLSKKRMGLSGTATQGDETGTSRTNWVNTEELVAEWGRNKKPLTLEMLGTINKSLCEGLRNNGGDAGVFLEGQEIISEQVLTLILSGLHVKEEMSKFLEWLNDGISKGANPVVLAAQAYQRMVSIHPFCDGNGRTTRMVMDYVLQSCGLPPAALSVSNVAVFGSKSDEANVHPDLAAKVVRDGVLETCKILGIKSPFLEKVEVAPKEPSTVPP